MHSLATLKMASTEVAVQPDRKLSVVDTLEHARRALAKHRQFMERRASRETFGMENDEESASEESRETVRKAGKGRKEASNTPSVAPPAPPTSIPQLHRRRKQAATSTGWKKRTSRVSPFPVPESIEEEEEEEEEVVVEEKGEAVSSNPKFPRLQRARTAWADDDDDGEIPDEMEATSTSVQHSQAAERLKNRLKN